MKFALNILAAMPNGTGAVMIDGKMQDDATWKQAKVVVDLAKIVAGKDAEMAAKYGIQGGSTDRHLPVTHIIS